jgi:SPX domain protein involved in polyphosphate accumulation
MNNEPAAAAFFQRYEQKYLLNTSQYRELLALLHGFVRADEYEVSTIYSVYYDNDEFGITRNSSHKSAYKEKLRLRSYGIPEPGDTVYLELKKKLKGVTYKQRIPLTFTGTEQCLNFRPGNASRNYIRNEIAWVLDYYKPFPQFMVCYNRRSFRGVEDKTLRITFDTNIRWRASCLELTWGGGGLWFSPACRKQLPHGSKG